MTTRHSAPDREIAIRTDKLTRRFGDFTAVDSLDITVERGTIYGFLGPNGSGKSTVIRMLCGLLEPSDGTAVVAGNDIRSNPEGVKRSIGYMNQSFSLYRDLSVDENLNFYGGIYGLRGAQLRSREDELVDLLDLGPYRSRLAGKLSGGWQQRLSLGAALIHEPAVMFLDEPTAGIDPVARRDLWNLLFNLADSGKTLFVSTHYMDEAERCHNIGYIYNSVLIANATPQELKALPIVTPAGTRRVAVSSSDPARMLRVLRGEPYVLDTTFVEAEAHLLVKSDAGDEEIAASLTRAGIGDVVCRHVGPSLEDVFVALSRNHTA
jgi:ABC-type multidrug transport system ATPase subunit